VRKCDKLVRIDELTREREREREIISLSFFLDDENHDHVPLLVLDSAANDYHVIIFFVYKLSDVA